MKFGKNPGLNFSTERSEETEGTAGPVPADREEDDLGTEAPRTPRHRGHGSLARLPLAHGLTAGGSKEPQRGWVT